MAQSPKRIAKRIAVVGAGLIGRQHCERVPKFAQLAAIVDPSPEAKILAQTCTCSYYQDLQSALATEEIDGAIIATPNALHVRQALQCLERGIPVLIEKPIADLSTDAEKLFAYHDRILVGHHRRHSAMAKAAKDAIDAGRLGDLTLVDAQFWLYKPQDYFDAAWRTKAGAGPIFINLIHDIDLLRYFCGDIKSVFAKQSNRQRSFEVEDTAALMLAFETGALGSVTVSDTTVAPWSWEFTAHENPAYPKINGSCYRLGGTEAALSVPDLTVWHHPAERSWWAPIETEALSYKTVDPLEEQMRHFLDVIDGKTKPLVSVEEATKTLRVVEAIKQSADESREVAL